MIFDLQLQEQLLQPLPCPPCRPSPTSWRPKPPVPYHENTMRKREWKPLGERNLCLSVPRLHLEEGPYIFQSRGIFLQTERWDNWKHRLCLDQFLSDICSLLISCFQWLNSRGNPAYLSCLDSENQHFSTCAISVAQNLVSLFQKSLFYLEKVLKKNNTLSDICWVSWPYQTPSILKLRLWWDL